MIAFCAIAGIAFGWVIHAVRHDRWHARHGVSPRLHDGADQDRFENHHHNGSVY